MCWWVIYRRAILKQTGPGIKSIYKIQQCLEELPKAKMCVQLISKQCLCIGFRTEQVYFCLSFISKTVVVWLYIVLILQCSKVGSDILADTWSGRVGVLFNYFTTLALRCAVMTLIPQIKVCGFYSPFPMQSLSYTSYRQALVTSSGNMKLKAFTVSKSSQWC